MTPSGQHGCILHAFCVGLTSPDLSIISYWKHGNRFKLLKVLVGNGVLITLVDESASLRMVDGTRIGMTGTRSGSRENSLPTIWCEVLPGRWRLVERRLEE